MDYLKLSQNLKKEFLTAAKAKYGSMDKVAMWILMILFIPLRVGFFFGRLFYWFTWFFFKGISAPVDFMQKWLHEQKEGIHHATQAVLYFVCMPFIFTQQVILAFNSFAFFTQWFGLMLNAYIMSLGTVKWQPVVTEAVFEEETACEEVA